MRRERIIAIDIDEDILRVIESILSRSSDYYLVASYNDAQQALAGIVDSAPDIVVTNVVFPGTQSLDYLQLLKQRVRQGEILVVTDTVDERIIMETITYGVAGYLLKKNIFEDLIPALHSVSIGGSPLDVSVARKLISHFQLTRTSLLTPQESRVLKLITQGKTYSKIAEELHITNETSKTHIRNIYRKLQVNSKAAAVTKAYRDKLVNLIG